MSERRPLAVVVTELAESLALEQIPADLFRVTMLSVDVPVEAALVRDGDDILFIADVPRWRWRSEFDRQPGRLTLHIGSGVPA